MNIFKRNSNAMFLYNSKDTIPDEAYFITSWETDSFKRVVIPVNSSYQYNYKVDWGDGNKESITINTDIEHEYVNNGTYDIKIYGDFPQLYMNNSSNKDNLKDIKQWGYIKFRSFYRSFMSCKGITSITAIDTPDLSLVDSFNLCFFNCSNLTNGKFDWDMNNNTNLDNMFSGCISLNCDISITSMLATTSKSMFKNNLASNSNIVINTSNSLKDVSEMFMNNTNRTILPFVSDMTGVSKSDRFMKGNSLFNSSINDLVDVMGLSILNETLSSCELFNQPITFLSDKVTMMEYMLSECNSFDSDLTINTINLVSTKGMFSKSNMFNKEITFNTSNVTDMSYMFESTDNYNNNNKPLSFDTSNVLTFKWMFKLAKKFNQDISNLNFSKATNLDSFMSLAHNYNNNGNLITMNLDMLSGGYSGGEQIFSHCNLLNQDINLTGCNNLSGLPHFLSYSSSFNSNITISNSSKLYNIRYMFYNATNFNKDISLWGIDFSEVTEFEGIFKNTSIDTTNYSKFLIELDNQSVKPNLTFDPGDSLTYNSTATTARDNLINNDGWTITDGGLV